LDIAILSEAKDLLSCAPAEAGPWFAQDENQPYVANVKRNRLGA
jgi:hypothetical protein